MNLSLDTTVRAEELRRTMRNWTTGITIVTAVGEDGPYAGIVSNSFTSVTLEPALVSWCVDRGSTSFPTWCRTEAFSVHVLGEKDAHLVPRFAAGYG
jgi:3-hydroxy-9,10-secoandrosta-1,3,5(10)-triene-9,17-dione monooxygenase reductase component